jgi:2'-5' RNA ligase
MKRTLDSETLRSFLALEISDEARDWIEERSREMKRELEGSVRWVKREALHITLHFFGKVPVKAVGKVGDLLYPLAEGFSPFLMRVKGIGAFPNLKNPRVLWVGIEDMTGGQTLRDFHAALLATLKDAGFPVDKRPFTPHVTIGRVKRFMRFDWGLFRNLPVCPPFIVRELTFFQSQLTPKGSIYQPLNHFSFGGEQHDRTN